MGHFFHAETVGRQNALPGCPNLGGAADVAEDDQKIQLFIHAFNQIKEARCQARRWNLLESAGHGPKIQPISPKRTGAG